MGDSLQEKKKKNEQKKIYRKKGTTSSRCIPWSSLEKLQPVTYSEKAHPPCHKVRVEYTLKLLLNLALLTNSDPFSEQLRGENTT